MSTSHLFDPVERYNPTIANIGILLVHLLGIFLKLNGYISTSWALFMVCYAYSLIVMGLVTYWYARCRKHWPSWDRDFVHVPLTAVAIQIILWWRISPEAAHAIALVWIGFFPMVNGRISLQALVIYATFLITAYLFLFAPAWSEYPERKIADLNFLIAFLALNFYLGLSSQLERQRDLIYIKTEKELRRNEEVLSHTNAELARLSCQDPLTELLNRRGFANTLGSSCYNTAILAIDIDDFKRYNDYFGHPEGDECLKKVARLLKIEAGDHAVVSRHGGEEFIIALPDITIQMATRTAERIRIALLNLAIPHPEARAIPVVSISLGIAHSTHQTISTEILLQMADIALYQAKQEGRNRWKLFTPALEKKLAKAQIESMTT